MAHPQPHSHVPVGCEELPEEAILHSRALSCNVSSPIFREDSMVSASSPQEPSGQGL